MNISVYQSCYDLVHTYIYGGVEMTSDMTLVATLISTCACLFIFAIPFILVYLFIKLLVNIFN